MAANLLQRGASWLADKLHDEESVPITYSVGAEAVAINATLGSQLLRTTDRMGNTKVERTEADFIFPAAELVIGGEVIEPAAGHSIVALLGGDYHKFEVMAPTGEAPYRYADPYRYRLRVHAKYVSRVGGVGDPFDSGVLLGDTEGNAIGG